MISTRYICDTCKLSHSTNTQFWQLDVFANCIDSGRPIFASPQLSIQVCRGCLESLGIYAQRKLPSDPAPVLPTVESAIREIVRCSLADAGIES